MSGLTDGIFDYWLLISFLYFTGISVSGLTDDIFDY